MCTVTSLLIILCTHTHTHALTYRYTPPLTSFWWRTRGIRISLSGNLSDNRLSHFLSASALIGDNELRALLVRLCGFNTAKGPPFGVSPHSKLEPVYSPSPRGTSIYALSSNRQVCLSLGGLNKPRTTVTVFLVSSACGLLGRLDLNYVDVFQVAHFFQCSTNS